MYRRLIYQFGWFLYPCCGILTAKSDGGVGVNGKDIAFGPKALKEI